ncbi:glutamine synthetase [Candidatus Bathyarchaeota archaeon]|nr:glutamine synthetase [Candidatus Bathyarchaeota archaeon]
MYGKLGLHEIDDVVRFIEQKNVKLLNFCHVPEDGRLKMLSFAVTDRNQVTQILDFGERVDGSSLFSFIDPHKSDIYIAPKLHTAFLHPFNPEPTLNFLCRYLDQDGKPLDIAPENVLARAEQKLFSSTSVSLKLLAELEFFLIAKQEAELLFPSIPEKNYHETAPFSKFEHVRNEILLTLANIGISTKYGHSEVGKVIEKDGNIMEQHEIEFAPHSPTEMAETVAVAKWVIRNTCMKHGVSVSFAPKIALEHAGSGMHVHVCGTRNGKNIIDSPSGDLSSEAKEMIGGIMKFAPSLAAFGNPTPISYLRFIARKESPMNICWGTTNRLALIRIPLWWNFKPNEKIDSNRRTFEYRAPDATANPYLLFAGLTVAIEYGLKNHEECLRLAEETHLEENAKKSRRFRHLPRSCKEAATNLRRDRKYYEADNIFPNALIEATVKKLAAYKDSDLAQKLRDEPQKIEKLMQTYFHQG